MSVESNLPRAVIEQNERAEAIIAQLTESSNATTDELSNDDSLLNTPPENTATSNVENTDSNSNPNDGTISEPPTNVDQLITDAQSVNTDIPTQQPISTPTEGSAEHWQKIAESWEHKYQVLAGKYNKEIASVREDAALRPEFDQLKQEKAALEQQIQALQLQLANKPKEQPSHASALESDEVKDLLTQLSDEYGDDLVNGIAQLIQATERKTSENVGNIADQVQAVSTTVEDVKRDASATTQQQAQQLYTQKVGVLTELLQKSGINFKMVDDDPLFHEWLSKFDANSGKQRQQILMELFHSGELESVAGLYMAYIQESGTGHSNTTAQDPAPAPSNVNFEEQVQVQPKPPRQEPELTDRRVWDSESISAFYQDVVLKKYSPEDVERIEREIFAQLREEQVS